MAIVRPLCEALFQGPTGSPCGGIGRRARLKIEFRKECWFDSGQGHQPSLLRSYGLASRSSLSRSEAVKAVAPKPWRRRTASAYAPRRFLHPRPLRRQLPKLFPGVRFCSQDRDHHGAGGRAPDHTRTRPFRESLRMSTTSSTIIYTLTDEA